MTHMKALSTLLILAAVASGIVAVIEVFPAMIQSVAYLFQNILAPNPQTLSEIVRTTKPMSNLGPSYLYRYHGMYSVMAVPVFIVMSIALAWLSLLTNEAHIKSKLQREEEEDARRRRYSQELEDEKAKILAIQNRGLQLEKLISRIAAISSDLPRHLKAANASISLAEKEFDDGMLDPFWDAVEAATRRLAEFHRNLGELASTLKKIHELKPQCEADGTKTTSLEITSLQFSDSVSSANRLAAVVRKSQRLHDFTSIFHVRKTNAILIEGFTTFGQALNELGSRISSAISDVNTSVMSLESTVRDVGSDVVSAIDKSADSQRTSGSNMINSIENLTDTVQVEANRSTQSDKKAVDILDNIQRDLTPADLSYKQGTVKKTR